VGTGGEVDGQMAQGGPFYRCASMGGAKRAVGRSLAHDVVVDAMAMASGV
jgi:hypothetical protein